MIVEQDYELVRVDEIYPHPENPREGDVGAIHESISENGFYGAVIVQRSTGRILAGNHRWHAARAAGIDRLPAIVADVDDETATRILLVDNRTNDLATYDESALAALLLSLDDLAGTGYELDDLEKLRANLDEPLALDDDEEPDSDEDVTDSYSKYSEDEIISDAVRHYRERGFPYRDVSIAFGKQQINKLASMPTEKLPNSDVGYHLADTYHPHRFAVPVDRWVKTPLDVFNDDKGLSRTVRLLLDNKQPITDSQLVGKLVITQTQAAANFRPAFALSLYRRFLPRGGTALDTSTGFGGRLVGFLASDGERYIGIDPNPPTYEGNLRLAADYGAAERVELINLPAEDVPHTKVAGRCDFAFTSPPYFAKERYSDDETQSWKRYSTGDAWRDGFLRPMLALQYAALKPGSISAVNIAPVKVGGDSYPLDEWTIDAGRSVGFEYVETEKFPISRAMGSGERAERFEPVILFRRP